MIAFLETKLWFYHIRVGYPSGWVGSEILVATIIHHLVKREREIRVKDPPRNLNPRLGRRGRTVIKNNLFEISEKPRRDIAGNPKSFDVGARDGI